jgi:hypothetical protein
MSCARKMPLRFQSANSLDAPGCDFSHDQPAPGVRYPESLWEKESSLRSRKCDSMLVGEGKSHVPMSVINSMIQCLSSHTMEHTPDEFCEGLDIPLECLNLLSVLPPLTFRSQPSAT